MRRSIAQNTFATGGLVDLGGPVLRLISLSQEDFFVLLTKLRHVHAAGDAASYLIPDAGLTAFMQHCLQRVGEAYFRTPRSTITAFINLLSVLEQNRDVSWEQLIGGVQLQAETNPDLAPLPGEEDEDAWGSAVIDRRFHASVSAPEKDSKDEGDDDDALASFKL